MKIKVSYFSYSAAVFRFMLAILAAVVPTGHAANYYLDSATGNDAAAGTDAATPWKSLAKANGVALKPGDQILLIRGGVWFGQLKIRLGGDAQRPVYVGAYGDKSKPRPTLHGEGKVEAPVFIDNGANHVTIEGLAVTNYDGKDIYDEAEGNRCGIKAGFWGGSLTNVKILNNEVYYVESCSNHPTVGSPRGTTLDQKKFHQYGCAAIFANASDMKDILIDGNEVRDSTGTGILVFAYNRVIGALIQHNRITNIGSDGIELLQATSPVVQYNSCIRAGNNSGESERKPGVLGHNGLAVCGMWAVNSSDVLFQYNYCEGTKTIKYDGQAWDFDMNLTGTCIYQYNFSRDNEGGFLLSTGESRPGYTRICRFNISVNDGSNSGAGQGFFDNICESYENNIFYRTDGKPFMPDPRKLSKPMKGTFTNNIFYTTATAGVNYQMEGRDFKNNCFHGHTPVDPGSHAVLADPLFTNAPAVAAAKSLKELDGFRLKPGSPCLGAGALLPNNGAKDFWGKPLSAEKANIGAQ
ncbi:MAG: right-handed parallel beta-helix repeat-containing protein [Candidatus Methylacidiphilales bacterium]